MGDSFGRSVGRSAGRSDAPCRHRYILINTPTHKHTKKTNPAVAAGIFLRAFHTVHAEGVIVRPAALALMYVMPFSFTYRGPVV